MDTVDQQDLPEQAAGAEAQPRAAAGSVAASCNTATVKYRNTILALRHGIDSLYMSYPGELDPAMEERLRGLKAIAQKPGQHEQAGAQLQTAGHILEVRDKGAPMFPYVLADKSYWIKVSSSKAGKLPLAYAQISSNYPSAVAPEAADADLRAVVRTLARVIDEPTVSRVDLFVDFISEIPIEAWGEESWVTKATGKHLYFEDGQVSGCVIGQGGPISARLYNKTLEIKKSKKFYLQDLWAQQGWFPGDTVWRVEFELKRPILAQCGIVTLPRLLESLQNLWRYATDDWLRLCLPSADSNRSRWPLHPLWDAVRRIPWGGEASPLLDRYSSRRAPAEAWFFTQQLRIVTAYMAVVGIPTFEEASRCLASRTQSFHEGRCFEFIGMPFEQLVSEKVAIKARQYNTRLNGAETTNADAVEREPGED